MMKGIPRAQFPILPNLFDFECSKGPPRSSNWSQMGPQNDQKVSKTNLTNPFRESSPAHCVERHLCKGICTESARLHLTKALLFTARGPYSHIHGLGQVLSTFVVQKDDSGASFEPLLHPCGTQKAQKCTPRTKVKKISKKLPKTFGKDDRLDQTWSSTETESMK